MSRDRRAGISCADRSPYLGWELSGAPNHDSLNYVSAANQGRISCTGKSFFCESRSSFM